MHCFSLVLFTLLFNGKFFTNTTLTWRRVSPHREAFSRLKFVGRKHGVLIYYEDVVQEARA